MFVCKYTTQYTRTYLSFLLFDSDDVKCPFNMTIERDQARSRSFYCSRDVCQAVMIQSTRQGQEHHQRRLGCYVYEGSVNSDMLPVYVNQFGYYLQPDKYSNPVMGITRWMVSQEVDGDDGKAMIRNIKHDDIVCPYDMRDGWEVIMHADTWEEDMTLSVTCVRP